MANKNLVIVRAGDSSLHPQWMLAKQRNWDLVISYYGNNSQRYDGQYDFYHEFKGSKWEGLFDFFKRNENLVKGYEYVWLPDDDLLTNSYVINDFFLLCKEANFSLAQPALMKHSFYSWEITLQQKNSKYRTTDFVEIMAPCFRIDCLESIKSTFGINSSGWGLEWLWSKLIKNSGLRMGIIDSTPIHHTRPVGSADHGGVLNSPTVEMDALLKKFNLHPTTPKTIEKVRLKTDILSLIAEKF